MVLGSDQSWNLLDIENAWNAPLPATGVAPDGPVCTCTHQTTGESSFHTLQGHHHGKFLVDIQSEDDIHSLNSLYPSRISAEQRTVHDDFDSAFQAMGRWANEAYHDSPVPDQEGLLEAVLVAIHALM